MVVVVAENVAKNSREQSRTQRSPHIGAIQNRPSLISYVCHYRHTTGLLSCVVSLVTPRFQSFIKEFLMKILVLTKE